jgi:hypothetical protein
MPKFLKSASPFFIFILVLGLLVLTNKTQNATKQKGQCSGKCSKSDSNKGDQTLYNPLNRLIVSL